MPNDQFSASDLLGSVVDDRFEVIEKLGEGGMGAVYKARQISMDRIVALKILLHDQRGDPISVERFRHEAYLASRLRHPNAIIIHDFGQSGDGLLYIAMEYLSGETLKARMKRIGQLPVRTAVKIIGQTLRTIAEAHRMGLIHRDLKPDNIFLTTVEGDTDFVKVLDFGIAKLTAVQDGLGGYHGGLTVQGKIYGTPNYMSPEQIRGKPVDHQSDLYQLGVIFYEMLAGRRPFEAVTPVDVMMMHLRDDPPVLSSFRPDVPPELERTVQRALEKDQRNRFQSGDELLEAIENFKFNSGFYAVPVRMAAMSRPEMRMPAAHHDDVDDSIMELGDSALMDPEDFVEEKTMMEFDDSSAGFDDADEKTIFEDDDDEDDLMTSAGGPPVAYQPPAELPSGIESLSAASQSFDGRPHPASGQRPREPDLLDVSDDEFNAQDPSLLVPIMDVTEHSAPRRPGGDRRTIAGLPGAGGAPRYVTPAPRNVPQKPTLAGHPGIAGFGPPPPRQPQRPAASPPASSATLQRSSPAPIAPRGAPVAAPGQMPHPAQMQPQAPMQQPVPMAGPAPMIVPQAQMQMGPPAPAPAPMHAQPMPQWGAAPAPGVMPVQAHVPSSGVAPPLALTPASEAPSFEVNAPAPARRGGGLVLKILLAVILIGAGAAGVVLLYPMLSEKLSEPAEPAGPPMLQYASAPDGVEIFDSGRFVGETPCSAELEGPAEKHEFRFAKGQFIFTATAGGRSANTWIFIKLPDGQKGGALGVAEIATDPAGAEVILDGKPIGKTPLLLLAKADEDVELKVGSATAKARPTAAGSRIDVETE